MALTDSEPVEATLNLVGVWLHDPEDPEGTARQFPYGRASRARAVAPEQETTFYAGRRYPVTEHGDPEREAYAVTVQVSDGSPTWATDVGAAASFATLRRTVMFRDNRGRAVYGSLSGYGESDQPWGTAIAFSVVRVDYDRGEGVAA